MKNNYTPSREQNEEMYISIIISGDMYLIGNCGVSICYAWIAITWRV